MNAIERLRHAADVHLSGLTVQRREQIAADLAAVVALYQAAKALEPDKHGIRADRPLIDALAAAVRRIEGDQ